MARETNAEVIVAVSQMGEGSLHWLWAKTVNNTGSCFGFWVPVCGFWVPVVCNASLFCVMCQCITQHVWGRGGCTTKKVVHYKKRWRITRNWYPKPANCYLKPQTRTTAIVVLLWGHTNMKSYELVFTAFSTEPDRRERVLGRGIIWIFPK